MFNRNIVAEVDGRWVHKGSVIKSFLHCITIGVNNTLCASYIKRTTVLWHPWMTLWSFTKLLKANCKALPVRQYWSIAFFRQGAYYWLINKFVFCWVEISFSQFEEEISGLSWRRFEPIFWPWDCFLVPSVSKAYVWLYEKTRVVPEALNTEHTNSSLM